VAAASWPKAHLQQFRLSFCPTCGRRKSKKMGKNWIHTAEHPLFSPLLDGKRKNTNKKSSVASRVIVDLRLPQIEKKKKNKQNPLGLVATLRRAAALQVYTHM